MIISKKKTALSILAAVATVSLAACGGPTSADGTGGGGGAGGGGGSGVPSQLNAATVTSFQLTQGQPGWAAGEESKVAGSSWSFSPSGQFAWVTSDTDFDSSLLPVTGSYTVSGDTITFHGQSHTASANGSATVTVDGSVQPDSSGYQVTMRMESSRGMAANVNNEGFASSNASASQSVIEASAA